MQCLNFPEMNHSAREEPGVVEGSGSAVSTHFVVSKEVANGRTRSRLIRVHGERTRPARTLRIASGTTASIIHALGHPPGIYQNH